MSTFYNPGQRINDRLQYTHPTKDPKEGNTLSYYLMDAPEKDFFDIPDTVVIDSAEGELQIPVNFGKRVKALYQNRGVIQILPNAKNFAEDDNIASSEKEARTKGDQMWKEYLRTIARDHYTSVEETKSHGGVPRTAQGLTKYALNFLQMEDPADRIDTITRVREGAASSDAMQAKIDALTATVNQLIGAKNAGKTA